MALSIVVDKGLENKDLIAEAMQIIDLENRIYNGLMDSLVEQATKISDGEYTFESVDLDPNLSGRVRDDAKLLSEFVIHEYQEPISLDDLKFEYSSFDNSVVLSNSEKEILFLRPNIVGLEDELLIHINSRVYSPSGLVIKKGKSTEGQGLLVESEVSEIMRRDNGQGVMSTIVHYADSNIAITDYFKMPTMDVFLRQLDQSKGSQRAKEFIRMSLMQGHILALGELLDKEYDTLDIIEFDESSKLFDSMNYLSNELGLNVLDNLKKQCDSYCSVFEHDILRVDAVPRNATFDLSYAMLQFPIYGIETRFNDVESLLEQVDMILEEEENEHYVSKVIAESVQVFDTEKMKFRTARELLAMDFARDPDYAYTESSDDEFSEKMQRSIYAIELSKRFSNLQAYISNNGPDVVQSHVVNRYVVNSSDDFSTREILDVEFNSQLGLYLSGQMELGEICGNFGFELPNEVQNNGYLLFDSMRRIAFLHKKLRKVDGGERQYVLDDIKDVMLPDELLQDQGKIGQVAKTIYLGLSEKLYI